MKGSRKKSFLTGSGTYFSSNNAVSGCPPRVYVIFRRRNGKGKITKARDPGHGLNVQRLAESASRSTYACPHGRLDRAGRIRPNRPDADPGRYSGTKES